MISLCLIVRDEAAMLPAFLDAVSGCWDELIAVDSGSTDDTVALLAAAGATVVQRPWTDDFAAARNASLDAASHDWVLVLDPDERPAPGFAAELRGLVAAEAVGAATIAMRNHLAHGHSRDVPLLRLFRRDGVRYQHAIHEDAFASVQAMLRRTGRELAALHTPVDHLGYTPERMNAQNKRERDVALLRRCVAADPDDLYSHFKLVEQARFWGDGQLMAEVAPPAHEALLRAGRIEAPWGGDLVVALSRATEQPLATLEGLAPLVNESAALLLARGELLEDADRLEEAADCFEACLELGEDPTAQLVLTRPLLGLSRVALAEGRFEDALEDVDAALETAPRDPEALLAALSLRTGAERTALAEALRSAHGDTVELARAEGEAALLAGDAADAIAPLSRVVGDPPSGRSAIHLAQALTLIDRPDEALAILLAVLPSLPEAGLGVVALDTIAGRERDLELQLTADVANQALLSWLHRLEGRPDLLLEFARRSEPLHGTFPWLTQLLA